MRRIDAVVVAHQADIFDDQSFDGRVSGPLPKTQQRPIGGSASIKPGRGGIDEPLMKIVVAMPFQVFGGNAGIVNHGPDDLGNTTGKRGPWIGDAITHGIAEPDLDRKLGLLGKAHDILGKGNTEPIDIGPGHIFKMASGNDSKIEGGRNDGEILPQHHPPVLLQFQKDVIIRDRGEDARLFQSHLFDQFEIVLDRPDPSCDLRIAVIPLQAFSGGLFVLLAVKEEFGLPDHPIGAPQLMKHVEEVDDLLHRIRRPGLLPVPEGGIGNKDLFGRIDKDEFVVEFDPANLVVGKDTPVEVGLLDIQKGKGLDGLALKGSLLSG